MMDYKSFRKLKKSTAKGIGDESREDYIMKRLAGGAYNLPELVEGYSQEIFGMRGPGNAVIIEEEREEMARLLIELRNRGKIEERETPLKDARLYGLPKKKR